MSWLFSRALVEASSAGTCSDGERSAPSSTTPTPQAFCAPDRMTAFSRLSRFGMTFGPSTDALGEAVLTWCLGDSRARTSAQPAREQGSPGKGPASGPRWRESSVRYDLATSSWRTHRCLFPEDLPWSSVTLPKWGSMRGGECWERTMPGLLTVGSGSGSWPTATASCARSEGMIEQMRAQVDRGVISIQEAEAMIGGSLTPPRMGSWPTPKASAAGPDFAKMDRSDTVLSLQTAVAMYPTPSARDWKDTPGMATEGVNPDGTVRKREDQLARVVHGETPGGSLNPSWVEWMMGWPLGYTALRPISKAAWDAWQLAFLPERID